MKIVNVSHSGIALAGRTAVRIVVEGTGFLRVNEVRRFVWRKLDAIILVQSAARIVVRAGGDKRELQARVMPDAPGGVAAPVFAPVRILTSGPRVAPVRVAVPRVRPLKLKIRNIVEGDEEP